MRSTPREELTIFASPSYFRVGGSQCRVTRMVSFSSSSILKEKFGSLLTPSFPWRFGGPTVYHLYGSSNRHTCKVVGATPAMAATSLAMVACAARIAPGPHVLITIYPSGNKLGVVGSKSVRRITSIFFLLLFQSNLYSDHREAQVSKIFSKRRKIGCK